MDFCFQEIEKYRSVTKELMGLEAVTHFDMFYVQLEDLKLGLIDTCKRHVTTLLEHVLHVHRKENLR